MMPVSVRRWPRRLTIDHDCQLFCVVQRKIYIGLYDPIPAIRNSQHETGTWYTRAFEMHK